MIAYAAMSDLSAGSLPRSFDLIWNDLEVVMHDLRRARGQESKLRLLAHMRALIEEAYRSVGMTRTAV